MTYKQAADILDPETRIEALVKIGYYGGFNSDEAQADAVNEACRLAAEVLRAATDTNVGSKWVKVKDRPPEEETTVLVAYIGLDGKLHGDQVARLKSGSWYWYDGFPTCLSDKVLVDITQWMPLPELTEDDGV